MKITILGSGSYEPTLERHSSAYLLENGGKKICFDFGRGAIDQLLKLGIAITEIDCLFISHWDPDHVADLLALMHYTRAPLPPERSLIKPRAKPLKIYGPKGSVENFDNLMAGTRGNKSEWIDVRDLSDGQEVEIEGIKIQSFETNHSAKMACFCYRISNDGKVLAYSGDTGVSEGLKNAIKDADLAIIEASWPEVVQPNLAHMSGEKAGKVAAESGVKKLVLTHFAPWYLKNFDPVADAKKYFKGEVILAEDLLTFKLQEES